VLAAVKSKYNTLYSVVRTARPHFEPGKVVLEFSFAFHQKRIQETKNREIIASIISSVTNEDVAVQCVIGEGQDPHNLPAAGPPQLPPEEIIVHTVAKSQPAAAPQPPATPEISAISNIFGGVEVLES
jgi:hypothetical protein